MKKLALLTTGLLASLLTAQAQVFTQGNLTVVRLSGFDTTSSPGAAVFIDQYTTNGTLVSSFAVPTTGANSLILNGEPYEGLMTLTPASTSLVFSGFNIALASTSGNLLATTSASAPDPSRHWMLMAIFPCQSKRAPCSAPSLLLGAALDGTNYWLTVNGPAGQILPGQYPSSCLYGNGVSASRCPSGDKYF